MHYSTIHHHDYLAYLKHKEHQLIFQTLHITHGHFSAFVRASKGYLLGFCFANLFISSNNHITSISIAILGISLILSIFLINYQVRHFRRTTLHGSVRKAFKLMLYCSIPTLFTLIYTDFFGMVFILSFSNLFASLSYSFE